MFNENDGTRSGSAYYEDLCLILLHNNTIYTMKWTVRKFLLIC